MQSKDICLLAARIAKGGTGMVAMAGQFLNTALEDLKLVRDLKINRVTQSVVVQAGSNGPFTLESDYLRTYDMFYPLQTPQGMTQFLDPITMEQYDAEFKGIQTANYPYEFATDLSTQAQAGAGSLGPTNGVVGLTAVQYGNYGSIPAISFTGGGGTVSAVANALMGCRTFLWGAGANYAVGDLVTLSGGVIPATFVVSSIGVGGAIAGLIAVSAGQYAVLTGPNAPTTTNGGGNGATISVTTWFLMGGAVTNPGYYLSAPTAVVSGGLPTTAGTLSVQFGAVSSSSAGQFYIYPASSAQLTITHRYMRNQPDIANPETSSAVPWFPHTQYLIDRTAWGLMGVTGDDRRDSYLASTERLLAPYLISEGDEQQTVKAIKLDPSRFRQGRFAKPIKTMPY